MTAKPPTEAHGIALLMARDLIESGVERGKVVQKLREDAEGKRSEGAMSAAEVLEWVVRQLEN